MTMKSKSAENIYVTASAIISTAIKRRETSERTMDKLGLAYTPIDWAIVKNQIQILMEMVAESAAESDAVVAKRCVVTSIKVLTMAEKTIEKSESKLAKLGQDTSHVRILWPYLKTQIRNLAKLATRRRRC